MSVKAGQAHTAPPDASHLDEWSPTDPSAGPAGAGSRIRRSIVATPVGGSVVSNADPGIGKRCSGRAGAAFVEVWYRCRGRFLSVGIGTLGRVSVAAGGGVGSPSGDPAASAAGSLVGPHGGDEALARRLKALACTAPLHDLDGRKSRLDWADASIYQMAEIGLQAIDQVTIAMDFDHGASHDQVLARLLPFIAAHAPGRDRAEYERVARWVLECLINVGSLDRGFRAVYGVFAADGGYRRRTFDFKLLVELVSPDGEVYLRTSDEAINVLVGALDTDVESAQIAAEVKLENLIKRGRLSDAQVAAEQARYRTVQYAEVLRRKLEATRRDVRAVDWLNEVPDLIAEALAHIAARYKAENAILANITQARDEAEELDRKRRAAHLVELVRDCVRRHTQLQARLQTAGQTFRAEQDRQQFAGPPQRATVDLFGQLLVPLLRLPAGRATAPTAVFFRAAAGTTQPTAARLTSLVDVLLSPPRERDPLGEPIPEPELAPLPDPDRFDADVWSYADELLELTDTPRRLSGLLAEARSIDPDLPHLVALRALHAVSPEIGVALRQGDPALLVAVDDGRALSDPQFAGADLLVGVATLHTSVAEPANAEMDGAGMRLG
jgi:hypothetical protein